MKKLQVALGVIQDSLGRVLLTQRNKGGHLQGYWEFPGGKVDEGESYKLALRRELFEELNIKVIVADKIIGFEYQYPELLISFEVFRVANFNGEVTGAEHQNVKWVHIDDLLKQALPPANTPILDALQLPAQYMIADFDILQNSLLDIVEKRLTEGVRIVQLRAKSLRKNDYLLLANQLHQLCSTYQARFITNCTLSWLNDSDSRYVHITSSQLKKITDTPQILKGLEVFSAACHDENEIEQANLLGARCILLGAVNQTESHPTSKPLGWNRFGQLCCVANRPVFALGGVGRSDLATALAFGAQGVAGIRDFI